MRLDAKTVNLGALGAQLTSKRLPKSPKWRQTTPKKDPGCSHFEEPRTDLVPRSLSEHSCAPFWWICNDLSMKCHSLLQHVGLIFDAFLATNLQTTKATCHDDSCAIRGQLPTTPLGAPFSQYFWRPFLSNAKLNAKNRQELTKTKS